MPKLTAKKFGQEGYDNLLRKFGRITGLSDNEEAIMWDGGDGYNGWLDSEEDIEWHSSSANDAPGNSGCNIIQFTGQGADGLEKTYVGQLNGTTWTKLSDTDFNVLFDIIYTAQCLNNEGSAGSASRSPLASDDAANAGTITIRSVTTQQTMAIIKPHLGRTLMMIWRCPADKFGSFEQIGIYPNDNQPFVVKLMGRLSKEHSWTCVGQLDIDTSAVNIAHPFPDYVAPGTDLCLVVTADSGGADCSAQMWIKKHDILNYEELQAEGVL